MWSVKVSPGSSFYMNPQHLWWILQSRIVGIKRKSTPRCPDEMSWWPAGRFASTSQRKHICFCFFSHFKSSDMSEEEQRKVKKRLMDWMSARWGPVWSTAQEGCWDRVGCWPGTWPACWRCTAEEKHRMTHRRTHESRLHCSKQKQLN